MTKSKSSIAKAKELVGKTTMPHTVWWCYRQRRVLVSCTAWIEQAVRSQKIGGKDRILHHFTYKAHSFLKNHNHDHHQDLRV